MTDPLSSTSTDPDNFVRAAPRSPAMRRAVARYPEDMALLVQQLSVQVSDSDTMFKLMHLVSREAVRLLTGVTWAGVTAQFTGPPFTAANTDARVLVVDEGQYQQHDGPCLRALRTDRSVWMSADEVRDVWPLLAVMADEVGVRAFRAEPLHVENSAVGSLNLYSAIPGGLTNPDTDLLMVLTEYLDRGLTDYCTTRPGENLALRIRDAVQDGNTIGQAVGILMALGGIDATSARDMLHRDADHRDVPILQIARDLVDRNNF